MNFAQKAASGLGWMLTSAASIQGIGLLVNTVLARLLLPTDFGAVALVVAVIGVLQTFAELGTSVALVQREHLTRSLIDSAFLATVILTLSIVALMWSTASYFAHFFRIPVLAGLLKIAAFSYLFRGIFSLHRCILLRDLRYKEISIIEFGSVLLNGIATIVLAYQGHGPHSIVWGQLLSTVSVLMAGFWLTKYIPGSLGSIKDIRELLSFGMWVSLGRILGNAAGKFDNFVIGKFLAAATLGSYYMAQKIVMLIPNAYTGIIDQVTLPIYSRFQRDPERVEEGYFKTLSLTSIILLPPSCLIFTFADPLVRILLGSQWLQVIPLIMIMSLFGIAQSLGGGVFSSVIYSLDQPQLAAVVNIFRIIALPGCIIIGSFWGVFGVAWGFALYGVIGRLINQWMLTYFLGFSFVRYFRVIFPSAFSAFPATGAAYYICYHLAHGSLWNTIIWNLSALIVWCGVYYLLIRLLGRDDVDYMWSILIRSFRKTIIYRALIRPEAIQM